MPPSAIAVNAGAEAAGSGGTPEYEMESWPIFMQVLLIWSLRMAANSVAFGWNWQQGDRPAVALAKKLASIILSPGVPLLVGWLLFQCMRAAPSGPSAKVCWVAAVAMFVSVRLAINWLYLTPSVAAVAAASQLLSDSEVPVEGQDRGAGSSRHHSRQRAERQGMPSGTSTRRSSSASGTVQTRNATCSAMGLWLLAMIAWIIGWCMHMICYIVMTVLGVFIGSHLYINRQAQQHGVLYLALAYHSWSMAVLCIGWASVLLFYLHQGVPRTMDVWLYDMIAVVYWFVLLHSGLQACADLQKDCRDHKGGRLSAWSLLCFDQGVKLMVQYLMPLVTVASTTVIHASVGAWVVLLATHGKLPHQVQQPVRTY